MDLSLLAELKDLLINAKEFKDVWSYFLDHFGEDPEFMNLGERGHDAIVEALIIRLAKQGHGITVKPSEILLTRLPEHQFIHGGICKNGKMINVLYFADIAIGTIMVCSLGNDETVTMRFSGRIVTDPSKPSMN